MIVPLLSILRDRVEELRIFGEVYIDAGKKGSYHTGEAFGKYPARSTLKPFQFIATGNGVDEGDRRARTTACMGSPSASLDQIEQLMDWYGQDDWAAHVKSPAVWPYDPEAAVLLKDRGDPSPIFGMCFSKHMAILEACRREGWDTKSYLKPTHPFQKRLVALLNSLIGDEDRSWLIDGCGLQTPVLATKDLAGLYRQLAASPRKELAMARRQMMDFPDWIGGAGRADTHLMQENPKRVVAKEGADGLLCVGITAGPGFPDGVGVAVKISHGLDQKMLLAIVHPLIKLFGLKSKLPSVPRQNYEFHFTPFKTGCDWLEIGPKVVESSAVFPGDTPYRRKMVLNSQKGDHLTLSTIETTVHVGAHADAPNHFSKDKRGIDSMEVSNYAGRCQVIRIKRRTGAITVKDLGGEEIGAPRILFRTDSFPKKGWHDSFAVLSPELIAHLGTRGVVLVGIDTPSIDESRSKTMPSHKATLAVDMRILEGLDLSGVEDGYYDLFAVPLRLTGADGSPVRALLRRLPYSGRSTP
ncbi:MAG: asparaginase, partial [Deltaproteobacteria bacterium]|nr:asparaginase [Deltaproteobacteria bacterium]